MDDVDIADETTEVDAASEKAKQFADLGAEIYGEDFNPDEAAEYVASKEGFVKRHNDLLTEAGRKRDEAVDKLLEIGAEKQAPAPPQTPTNGPVINAASFAHELGFNAADFSSEPSRMWDEPITLRQLYATTNGVATWGKNQVESMYGGPIPQKPEDRINLTGLSSKAEDALERAISTDTTLTGMLTEATVEDLVGTHDLAERDDIRKGIDEYDAGAHGDFDPYIEGIAKASHDKFDSKLSEKSTKERDRRKRTAPTLRTGNRGGGIPSGEKEPDPWTEEGMRQVARRLREQQSFGE